MRLLIMSPTDDYTHNKATDCSNYLGKRVAAHGVRFSLTISYGHSVIEVFNQTIHCRPTQSIGHDNP